MPDSFSKITSDILGCKKCPLYRVRKNPVVGSGSEHAKIMFVGEAPGANEDLKGVPFCGAAGKVLDGLLNYAGIKRNEVYITNILKCRPPANRNPKEEEIKLCVPYLDRQIALIKPKAICCLGNFAVAYIMKKFGLKEKVEGISRIHGKVFSCRNIFDTVDIITFYHPAVATYNINMKATLKKDFLVLKKYFS